jgi:hypothetical protein
VQARDREHSRNNQCGFSVWGEGLELRTDEELKGRLSRSGLMAVALPGFENYQL